ncbi:YppG family protein [Gracilibacillus marinus]|jgi:hypothetical protein|uniref:YppG family protein n=1 Tax=Gracilibacillus marinus TaxID=630535 RepID=A0ABV8VVF2_9BACI
MEHRPPYQYYQNYPNQQTHYQQNPYVSPDYMQQATTMTPFQYYQKPTLPLPYPTYQPSPNLGKQANPFISYFQTKDGEMDFDKVFQTVNQLAATYQQVSPLVKNVTNLVKSFKA